MHFATTTVAVVARISEFASLDGNRSRISQGVAGEALDGDFLIPDTLDLGCRAFEAILDEIRGNTNRLEDLSSTIAVDHRNAHLGHDLEKTSLKSLAVIENGLGKFGNGSATLEDFPNGLESEIRIYRTSTITNKAGDLMHVTGLASLANKAGFHPLASANKVVMNGSRREKHRHSDIGVIHATIRKNNETQTGIHRRLGFRTNAFDRDFKAFLAIRRAPKGRDRGGFMNPI